MAVPVKNSLSQLSETGGMTDTNPLLENNKEKSDGDNRSNGGDAAHEAFVERVQRDIAGYQKLFAHPALDELEEQVKRNIKILDDAQEEIDEERRAKRRELLSKHIPGPLKGTGQTMEAVMKRLEELIIYEHFTDDTTDRAKLVPASLSHLNPDAEVAILAHSLGAYMATLSEDHLRHISTKIITETSLWMSRLFRFSESSAFFSEDRREGLARVCRLVLHHNYPKYALEGFEALYSKPPVIYVSGAAAPGLGQFLCSQLGLPMSCLSQVPCNTLFGSRHKMDIAALEKLISDDQAAGKTPLLLVAYAGTPLIGEVDNLTRLQEICKTNNIWLHLEGHDLAMLSWFSVPTVVQPAVAGDSMTLDLGTWIGVPALPYTTLYKSAEAASAHASGLTSFSPHYRLSCLPMWICLQTVGHENVVRRIQHSVDMSELLLEQIRSTDALRLATGCVPKDSNKKEAKTLSLREAISNMIHALVIFEITNPTVVFRYVSENQVGQSLPYISENGDDHNSKTTSGQDPYYNALNIWLAETLQREVPEVAITVVDVQDEGTCIRFSALETVQVRGTKKEHMEKFIDCLLTQMEILNATVKERETFQNHVEAQPNLRLVRMPDWAGLGAVQYIPDLWVDKLDDLSACGKKEISEVNVELVHKLKTNDNAFALGKTEEDLACVRFGLITPATDCEELVAMVFATGKEIEESSKYLEKMSDIIKKGIEEANKDLLKENEEKLYQEGVLRQVPIVGSLYNWWSPPPKEATIKGRTFNLTSGKVASTESTYKYHMQIQKEPDVINGASQANGQIPTNGLPSSKRSSLTASEEGAH